jgi:CRP-like cAMP-binding protein
VIKDGQTVATLGEGEFFGEMALLTGEKRMARVEAAAPGRLLEIDRSAFKVLIETEPIMIRRVEKIFTDRVQAAQAVASDKARQPSLQSGLFNRFKQLFGL